MRWSFLLLLLISLLIVYVVWLEFCPHRQSSSVPFEVVADPDVWYIQAKLATETDRRYLVMDRHNLQFVDKTIHEVNEAFMSWRKEAVSGKFRLYIENKAVRWYIKKPVDGMYSKVTRDISLAETFDCNPLLQSVRGIEGTINNVPCTTKQSALESIRFTKFH